MSIHQTNRELIGRLRAALYDINLPSLREELGAVFAADCPIHLAYPFEDLDGVDALYETAYRPLLHAIPDLERRDFIVMAGESRGDNWVGCGGHYMGTFERAWLDIPPTRHLVAMRYHEFFRVQDGRIVEMQALWDIPQVMMQARAWPMTPSLGVEWVVPGAAGQDGIVTGGWNSAESQKSIDLVIAMLDGLKRNNEGAEAMELDRFWHPKFNWYGPAGIGSMRGISGFRNWHQIPFLKAMPNRAALLENGAMFGDGNLVGFTAWPGMTMTLSGDGWLGIPPLDKQLTMRSLDFWRREGDLLRENWVLVDILDVYNQIGVDVFERMRELTPYARP